MADMLKDKIALVTGAVSDIDANGGEETLSLIKYMGGDGMFVHADVSRPADVEAMVDAVVAAYGRLDCAYNNAGIEGYWGGRLHEYPEITFDRLMDINVKGVWLCLKYEIPQLLKQCGGAIVNTASAAGLVGSRRLSVYSASKHAVIGLTKSAALEYAADGIRVNAVCPGIIDTPMMDRLVEGRDDYAASIPTRQPIGRKGTPDEIAEAVAWLCSDSASLVTGLAMAVDGAFTAQ